MNRPAHLPPDVDVLDVQQLLAQQADPLLLDCRNTDEYAIAHIEGALWIPMDELEHRLSELVTHRQRHIVVFCHHQQRSAMVCDWLRAKGYPRVQYMRGGIDAWAALVDSSLRRY